MKKPKFKIDDIVCMEDSFSFNPAEKVLSIGKVMAIHIRRGREMGYNPIKRKSPKRLNDILYSISGFSLMPEENQLKHYTP